MQTAPPRLSCTQPIRRIVPSPHDPNLVLVLGGSETKSLLNLWDVNQKKIIRDFSGAHSQAVTAAAFNPQPGVASHKQYSVVAVSWDKKCSTWPASVALPATGGVHLPRAVAVDVTRANEPGKEYGFHPLGKRGEDVAFSSSGDGFAVSTESGEMYLYSTTAKIVPHTKVICASSIVGVKYSPCERVLVVASNPTLSDGTLLVLHLLSETERRSMAQHGTNRCVDDAKESITITLHQAVMALAFSQDGRHLAVCAEKFGRGGKANLLIYDTLSFKQVRTIYSAKQGLCNVADVQFISATRVLTSQFAPTASDSIRHTVLRVFDIVLGIEIPVAEFNSIVGCRAALSCDGSTVFVQNVKKPNVVDVHRLK